MDATDLHVQSLTRPGGAKANEDALVINPFCRVYGVIDGVSSLAAFFDEHGRTGGSIAAQLLASELNAHDVNLDLRSAVLSANRRLTDKMAEAGIDLSCKWARWGAVFAVFRIHDRYIEYVQSGDCMLFLQYADNSVRVLTRNQVAGFDLLTLSKKKELAGMAGITMEQLAEQLYPISIANRNRANTPDGYSVLNGEPELEDYMEVGRTSRANVSKIIAVSDGLFHLFEHSDDPGKWDKMISDLNALGIEGYLAQLTGIENEDPFCERYLRHKKSDDKSVVVVDLRGNTQR